MIEILNACKILPAITDVSKKVTTPCLMLFVAGMTSNIKAVISMQSSPRTSRAGRFILLVSGQLAIDGGVEEGQHGLL